MIEVGHVFTFTTPYTIGPNGWTDADFAARVGTQAEVIEVFAEDAPDMDFEEVGPMYRIRFIEDGVEMTAWPEEIDPSLITSS